MNFLSSTKLQSTQEPIQFEESATVLVENTYYDVFVATVDNKLTITIEDSSNAYRWIGSFTSSQIEEMSAKTGAPKRFEVMLRMFRSALTSSSSSVQLQIYLPDDLEKIKMQNQTPNGPDMNTLSRGSENYNISSRLIPNEVNTPTPTEKKKRSEFNLYRRYLVLVQTTEFDVIHYPYSLKFEHNPDPNWLRGRVSEYRGLYEITLKKMREADNCAEKLQMKYDSSLDTLRRLEIKRTELEAEVKALKGKAIEPNNLSQKGLSSSLNHHQKIENHLPVQKFEENETIFHENSTLRAENNKLRQLLRAVSVGTRTSIQSKMRAREQITQTYPKNVYFEDPSRKQSIMLHEYIDDVLRSTTSIQKDENETILRDIVEHIEIERRNVKAALHRSYEGHTENHTSLLEQKTLNSTARQLRSSFEKVIEQFARLLDFSLITLKDREDLEYRFEVVVEGLERVLELQNSRE